MEKIAQNCVLELSFESKKPINRPQDLELIVLLTSPKGTKRNIPAYWAGNNIWRARVASEELGRHSYETICSDPNNNSLHNQSGTFEVSPYAGNNPLFLHGKLRVRADKKHIEHIDGTPFFWLGDTWWMGFTKRLHWPEEFALLTNDRVQKGFTLIQIVAGLYPDMPPFDERGANEAGYPWQDEKFDQINPAYFDMVDRRVQHLVESGLVPCIVGFWGYFMKVMGIAKIKQHWRYLIARYSAYPVIWCIAGEAMMKYYLDSLASFLKERKTLLTAWSEVTAYVRSIDGYHNPITVHPTNYGHKQMDKPSLLDVNMLQTGHANAENEIRVIKNTVKMIQTAQKQQKMPVVVGEVCYEGILEANRQQIQRCVFWANFLSGGAGHTYGANGIWQLNRRDRSYGPSPHGASWGETPWEDAYQLPGSSHIGLGKAILSKYPWWELVNHPEWVNRALTFAAGIPGRLRIIYRFLPGRFTIQKLENDVKYNAFWVDPKNGNKSLIGPVIPDKKGKWRIPNPPVMQDWVIILEKIS